jgi:hypothetical protein
MPIARCPVCEDILTLGSDFALNQPVTCSTCLSNLKIVSVEPCELEEASRRPPRNYQQGGRSYSQGQQRDPSNGRQSSGGQANPRPAPQAPPDRRLPDPRPMPVFPPNPEKQVDNRRAQKWEKPKDAEAEVEEDEFNEFEDKLTRSRGKGKRK